MTEDNLINAITLIVLFGFFIYFTISLSKKWLPGTAIQPFRSFSEIKLYYSTSISIIRTKWWLLFLPLGFVLSQRLLIWFFTFKFFQPDIAHISEEAMNITNVFFGKSFLKNLIESFFHTPTGLDYGFNHSISQNIIFLGFFLICSLTYKEEIKKLKDNSTDTNLTNVSFINANLKASLLILIGVLLCVGILYLTTPDGGIKFFFYSFVGVSIFVLGLLCLSAFSLLQAFILFSVKEAIQPTGLKSKELLNKSLTVIKQLFILNIVLYSMRSLSSVMMLPATISQFFELRDAIPYNLIVFFQNASVVYSYFFSFLAIFIFFVPFILIEMETGVYNAFKATIIFIRNFLVKYLIFVGLGIIILFLPTLIDLCLNLFVNQYSTQSFLIGIFTIVLRVIFAVVFYIAMFAFIHDNLKVGVVENHT